MVADYSSYKTIDNIDKPDLMGVGADNDSVIIVPGFADYEQMKGTSFAAPQVTGAIAILMQQNFMLKNSPQDTKALIITSASSIIPDDYNIRPSGLDVKYGVGLLNLNSAMHKSSAISLPVRNGTNGQVVSSTMFGVSGFTAFSASLVNITGNRNNSDMNPPFSIYNLRVIDPNGQIVDIDNEPGAEGFFSVSKTTYNSTIRISTLLFISGWYTLEVVLTGNQVLSGETVGIGISK
jgi:subtilisin family serine protease